jgi:hypothetical protein
MRRRSGIMHGDIREMKLQYDSVAETIQGLRCIAMGMGKKPTHIVLSEEAEMRFRFEMRELFPHETEKVFECRQFCLMEIVVIDVPEIFIKLGYSKT